MNSPANPRSLQSIILFRIVPIAAVILLAIAAVSNYLVSQTLHSEVQDRVNASANHAAQQIDSSITALTAACQSVAANDMVVNGIVDIDHRNSTLLSYFRSLKLPGPSTQEVTMADYKGRVIVSTADRPKNYTDAAWYDDVMAGKPLVETAESTLTIAAPVLYAGRAEATIVSAFDLTELISIQFSPPKTEAVVLHRDGAVTYSTSPKLVSPAENFHCPNGWLDGTAALKSLTDHKVSYLESEDTALAAIRQMAFSQLVQFLVLLFGLVAAIRMAARLAGQPLNQMVNQVGAIESTGDLALRVEQKGPSEFQTLATGFNGMLEKLQNTTVSQERYRASEERLSSTIQGSNDGLWDWDMVSNDVWYSTRYKAMLGYSDEEFPNLLTSFESHLHPDDTASTWRAVEQHVDGSHSYDIEHRLRTKSGNYLWVRARGAMTKDGSGKPIRMSGSMQDISELKQYQTQLQNKTRELEEVLDALPIAMVYRSPDRKIVRVNRAFTKVFGYSEQEALGRMTVDLYADPEQHKQGKVRFNDDASVDLTPYEVKYKRSDGTRFIGETVGTAILDANGNPAGMLGLIADISQRKAAESELRINKFAVDNSSDAVFWIRQDGSFSRVNHQASNLLGYSEEQLCQMSVSDINSDFPAEKWQEHWDATKKLGVLQFETKHRRKDGTNYDCVVTKHYLSFEGKDFIFATARDISSQKKAESALIQSTRLANESERRFRALADAAAPLCWTTELDATCSWLNKRWLDYSGKTMEEQTGHGWLDTVHPDDLDATQAAYTNAFEKREPFIVAYRLRRADGVYRWHTANATPRFSDDGEFLGFVGMSFDDQDAKESREALEASELALKDTSEALQATLDLLGTSDGVWDWKVDTLQTKYTPGFRKILGFNGDDVDAFPDVLSSLNSRIHPDDKSGLWEVIDECFQSQTPFVFEFRVRSKDEKYIWVRSRGSASFDTEGNPVHLVGSIFDISAQKDVEMERDRFLNTAAELYAAVDLASLQWVKLNAAWPQTFGYSLETISATPWLDLHPTEEHKAIEKRVKRLLRGEPIRGWVCRMLHQDGSILYIEWNIDPPAPGETIVYGSGRDVTSIREYMSQIEETSRELEIVNTQFERSNQDLAQFAYVASHDLQEPLRAVGGFLQLLKSKYSHQLDETALSYVDKSVAGAARMNQLINDLLHYSKVTSSNSEFRSVDLNQCAALAQEKLASPIASSNADIRVQPLPHIQGIEPLLVQLFQNLIGNALKYRSEQAPIIDIWDESEADAVVIHVQDNGIGIAAKYRDQVFALFKRLHHRDEHPGTGIGLAICQRVAERHGGSISVSPNQNGGSCFSVRFKK